MIACSVTSARESRALLSRARVRLRFFHTALIGGALLFSFPLFLTPLDAYMPLRWSPLDVYVTRGKKGGPKRILVKAGNRLKGSADFVYNRRGFLLKEIYRDSRGKRTGETRYRYRNSRLISERRYNTKGSLIDEKIFSYNRTGLSAMDLFSGTGKKILSQVFRRGNSRIVAARESAGNTYERFLIKYVQNKPALMRIVQEDGKELSRIIFSYRADGKLKVRYRDQGSVRSKCVYQYDARGRIMSYSYYSLIRGSWRLDKTLNIQY